MEEVGGWDELERKDQGVLDKYSSKAPTIVWEYQSQEKDLGMLTHLKVGWEQ